MSDSPPIRKAPSPGGPRSQRPPSPAPAKEPDGRIKIDLVSSGARRAADNLEELLRGRLVIFGLIALGASTAFLVKGLVAPDDSGVGPPSWFRAAVQAAVVLVALVCTVLLLRRRQASLGSLRAIECVLLAALAGFFAWLQCTSPDSGWPAVFKVGSAHDPLFKLAAHGLVGQWFGLAVAYGTIIPNTWHRSAIVVGAIALAPLVLAAGFLISYWPVSHAGQIFVEMAILSGIGAAIGIYGAHRIETLRQEASVAHRLGQYQLKQRLGAGGMGEVYLAEHVLLRRPCAIKLIRAERADDPEMLIRFQREVQAMAGLTNGNTVEVYDYGHTADGTFYYVMEYLTGLTLQELVDRHGPLAPERVVHLLRQACLALREAHLRGLLHRDIKPGNIMACDRGEVYDVVKLLDFGLVRDQTLVGDDQLTQMGTVAGSPPYISPEQASAKKDLDARSDLYSLGAVAYFLLAGKPPFVRDTPMRTLMAHVYDPVPPLNAVRPDVPGDVEAVVLRCLEKSPASRFSDAESLEQALSLCRCAYKWTRQKAEDWWHRHVEPSRA
jgi:serine/threonine-protein kinase